MLIVDDSISRDSLQAMQENYFGDMVKAVVDIRKGLMALDAELHADLEKELLEYGSEQENLWGINLYPEEEGEDMVEFDSIINIRPFQDNPSRDVLDDEVRQQILSLVSKLVV